MMRWEVFIIPLIALGVWILGTIFRNAEEERQKLGALRLPGGGRGPTRRPMTDLDKFLEDARRRREQLEKREPPERKERPPQDRPPAPKTQRRREVPSPERRPPRPREVVTVPVAQPVAKPPRTMPEEMERVPVTASFPTPPPPVPVPPPAPVVVAPARVVPEPVVVQVVPTPVALKEVVVATAAPAIPHDRPAATSRAQIVNLLRNPSTRAAAFVLSEVLGPPLCRRRR